MMLGAEQSELITHHFQTAASSASPGVQRNHITKKMGSLLKRSKAIRSQLKTRPQVASALLIQLRQQETAELIRTQTFTENLNYKSRIKRLLDKKGMKAQQLFWNLINRKPKTKSFIEALEGSAGLEIDSDRKNSIEGFLDKKIITSYNQADISK